MSTTNCEHCQQPLLHIPHGCEVCDGHGYRWYDDGAGGYRAINCRACEGTGDANHCTNTECPGLVWYPLSRADATILRMVQAKIGEDGR